MYKYIVNIEGMACGMCESHINNVIRNAFDVQKVTSSHKKGKSEIISKQMISDDQIRKVIDETGYKYISMTSEPYEKKGLLKFIK